MLEYEKTQLRQQFDEQKHHVVVAINIFMYLYRWKMLNSLPASKGKTFEWVEQNINHVIDAVIPELAQTLT